MDEGLADALRTRLTQALCDPWAQEAVTGMRAPTHEVARVYRDNACVHTSA